jgi:hypothetical protein
MDINGTLALMIPIISLMIPMLAIWAKHRRQIEEIRAEATAEKAAQYAANNQRLEERVRVLERIITDRGTSLAHEIEALRSEDSAGAVTKKLQ